MRRCVRWRVVGCGGATPMIEHRLLVAPGGLVVGLAVSLDDEESHHLRVRRAETGQRVMLFDGAGVTGHGVLTSAGKGWQATVEQVEHHPPTTLLILAVGAGDRDRFLSLAEKCTELGVTRLIPLVTERSAQVETRLRESGVERARKRAREACKQSGNPWATVVADLTRIAVLGKSYPGVRWLMADPKGTTLGAVTADAPVGWLIGPEGGFTEPEGVQMGERLGAAPVRLGRHVMRFETAAIVAAGGTAWE